MSATVETLGEHLLDLAWSLWGGLGVSSWTRRHTDWLVEVEPLVAFTAHLGEHDRRLLGESIDWCVQHDRFLSLRQLRHVVTGHEWPSSGEIARFSATVQAHTGRRWPHAENGTPYAVDLSGKSRLPDLAQPGLLQLRLRAIFGVGARAEILRLLLVDPTQRWTLGELAQYVAYTRRQLSNEVDMLSVGGVLQRVDRSGVAAYRLADRAALVSFVGRVPTVAPSWALLLWGLLGLWAALDRVAELGLRQPAVELRRQLRDVEPALAAAGLHLPRGSMDEPDSLLAWSVELAGGLAQADSGWLPAFFERLS